ncbi:MAG TPA: hypothetical protein VGC97_25130 [Pyrinomonadaceae bacterium]
MKQVILRAGRTVNAPVPFEPWRVSGSGQGFVDSPVPTATQVTQGSFNAWESIA